MSFSWSRPFPHALCRIFYHGSPPSSPQGSPGEQGLDHRRWARGRYRSSGTPRRISFDSDTGVFSTALAFSVHDIEVVVLDKDPSTVTAWNSGTAPFEEPDLDAMLKACFRNPQRSLAFTTDTTAAIKGAQTHFICVDTPPLQATELMSDLDISDVVDAVTMIENNASVSGSIVLRSTMPLGATEHLAKGVSLIFTTRSSVRSYENSSTIGTNIEI